MGSASYQYRNARIALRNCLDAGWRSASAINREEERKGKVISGWWYYLMKMKKVMMKV